MGNQQQVTPAALTEATPAAAAPQIAQAEPPIGTIQAVTGTVTIVRADGSRATAQAGDPVHAGDTVETGADSTIGLTFLDGTQFALGAAGSMVLDEMVFDPATGDGAANFNLLSGTFSFVSGQLAKAGPDALKVATPVATIGIRGTSGTIGVGSGGDGSQLQVVLVPDADGSVGEILVTTADGQSFTLNLPLGALSITGPLVQTYIMTPLEFEQTFGDVLRSLPSGGEQIQDEIQQVPTPPAPEGPQGPAGRGPDDGPDLQQMAPQRPSSPEPPPLPQRPEPISADPVGPVAPARPDLNVVPQQETQAPPPQEEQPVEPEPPTEPEVVRASGRATGEQVFDKSHSTEFWTVTGDAAGNTILTGSGGDTILSGGGDDFIYTGAGDDTVDAGQGDDVIIGGTGAGDDAYVGGAGTDWVYYTSAINGVVVRLDTPAAPGSATGTDIGTDRLSGIENVMGGAGADTLIGNDHDNVLIGQDGNDFIAAGGGDNVVLGGAGNDTIHGGGGGDNTFAGGVGQDTVSYAGRPQDGTIDLGLGGVNAATWSGRGRDTLDSIEHAEGGDGNDTLYGSDADNILRGGAGNDHFDGGAGNDTYIGGAGRDTVAFSRAEGGVTVNLRTGTAENAATGSDTLSGIENVKGTVDDDTLIGDGGDNVLDGVSGSDIIDGGAGNDTLIGGMGINTLRSLSGNNTFIAGGGMDSLVGGSGNDTYVLQDTGLVRIRDGGGANVLDLRAWSEGALMMRSGDDLMAARSDSPTAGVQVQGFFSGGAMGTILTATGTYTYGAGTTGGAGNDLLVAAATGSTLTAAGGDDYLIGATGTDTLRGGAGADILVGGSGDRLEGGAGNDILASAGGANLMGGDGDDLYGIGDGDIIRDDGGIDTIDVGGVSEGHVFLRRSGDSLIVETDGSRTLTIGDHFGAGRVEYVHEFDDYAGTRLLTLLNGLVGTSGDDIMAVWAYDPGTGLPYGTTLAGGLGNDEFFLENNGYGLTIQGGAGDDEFVLEPGDVHPWGNIQGGAGTDTLVLYGGVDYSANAAPSSIEALRLEGSGTVTVDAHAFGPTLHISRPDTITTLEIVGQDPDSSGDYDIDLSGWVAGLGWDDWGGGANPLVRLIHGTSVSGADQTITSSPGADEIHVGAGTTAVFSGDGNDIIHATLAAGNVYDGGGDHDDIDFSGAGAVNGIVVDLTADQATDNDSGATVSVINIEDVTGTSGNDQITGDDADNVLHGNGGDDILVGGAGKDFIFTSGGWVEGGQGRDEISAIDPTTGLPTSSPVHYSYQDVTGLDVLNEYGGDMIEGWKSRDLIMMRTNVFDGFIAANNPYYAEAEIDLWTDEVTIVSGGFTHQGGLVMVGTGASVEVWYTTGSSDDFANGTAESYQVAELWGADLNDISGSNFVGTLPVS